MFEMPDPFGRTKPGTSRYGVGPLSRGQARAWAAGMDVAYGLIGMGLIGFALDYFLGTTPRWMLILGGVGLVWGVYRFIRAGLAINAASTAEIRGRRFLHVVVETDPSDDDTAHDDADFKTDEGGIDRTREGKSSP